MADNAELNAGSGGVTLAAASLSISGDTAVVQMVGCGILSGSEGSWSHAQVVGGAGAVAAGVQRTTLASDDPAVAHLANIVTAVQIMDDWDESDRAKVNPIVGQAGVAAGAGAVGVTVPRVTLASDDPAVAHLANIVTATQLIDDAIYIDDADWTDSTSKHMLVGGLYQSSPQSITDGDVGPFQVTSNGYLITSVNGTVTVGSHAVTNAGTFAVQVDGAALTALQLIDDAIYADDADWTDNTSKHMLVGGLYQSTPQTITDGDVGPIQVSDDGHIIVHLIDGGGNDLEFAKENDNWNAADHGVILFGRDEISTPDKYRAVRTDASGHLLCVSDAADDFLVNANLQIGDADAAGGAGVLAATVQRVTIATDDEVNNLLTTIDSDTNDIKTAVELLDNAVDGNYLNVNANIAGTDIVGGAGAAAAGVQRVVVASDSPGMAVLGTATYSEATTVGVPAGAVRNDDKATLGNTDNEIVPLQVDAEGALYVNPAAAENKSASGVAAGGAPGTDDMIAAVGGKKLLITAMSLTATSTTTNSVFVDNVDNDLYGNTGNPIPLSMDADGDTIAGIVLSYNPAGWFKTDAVNEAVTLNSSAAQDIIWAISWIETD